MKTAKLTCKQTSFSKYAEVLGNLQPFTTSGALKGESFPDGIGMNAFGGRLPDKYRDRTEVDYVVSSYRTPIAWRVKSSGEWIIPDESYSVTTSSHQSKISAAVSSLRG